jgi:hypothetical protein
MIAESSGRTYVAFETLSEAKQHANGVAILQADDAGQIYVVCPTSLIECSAESLDQFLVDIDKMQWNDASSAGIFFEEYEVGDVVPGGMGGGIVIDGIWIHPRLSEVGVIGSVEKVLRGERSRI